MGTTVVVSHVNEKCMVLAFLFLVLSPPALARSEALGKVLCSLQRRVTCSACALWGDGIGEMTQSEQCVMCTRWSQPEPSRPPGISQSNNGKEGNNGKCCLHFFKKDQSREIVFTRD